MRNRTIAALGAVVVVAALIGAAIFGATGNSSSSSSSIHLTTTHSAAVPAKPRRPAAAPAQQRIPAGATDVTVSATAFGRSVPPGFVGLSIEYPSLQSYTGTDPAAINPVFVALVKNLAPRQQPDIRFGGESGDFTWWPILHVPKPTGVRYALTPSYLALTKALAQQTNARLIMGINLEVNSAKVAAAEGQAIMHGIGRPWVQALELGNEPELYPAIPWFVVDGVPHFGRPRSYDFADYQHDFATVSSGLPDVPLAGPSVGSPQWSAHLNPFLAAHPRVRIATLHRYPLKKCTPTERVTISQLLSVASSRGLAVSAAPYTGVAHGFGLSVRIDEMNSVSCGGAPGVSDTFAAALWAADALFNLAAVGVDGVNIHTRPNNANQLFSFTQTAGKWRATVYPEYYGLLMFAQAAPSGARLLHVSGAGGPLAAWATRASDASLRVLMINKDTHRPRTLALRLPGAATTARLERLLAPSAAATSNLTLGGQRVSDASGQLAGAPDEATLTPVSGRYVITLPKASAALLTVAGS